MAQQGDFEFVPLWPFRDEAEAVEWQAGYRTNGVEPWHLDAEMTALAFTQEYLGMRTVDQVVDASRGIAGGSERFVGVGFAAPNGAQITAAVLHLARIGGGDDAPWEVVGSEGGTLSVEAPRYGAKVASPLAVRGHITGVDESLTVQIRVHGRTEPVGMVSGIAAGGTDDPWSATVPYTAAPGSVLTIAVSTGGHIAEVEHFAVTGARC